MSFVRTMKGDIKPENMGFTYSHEHIVCIPPYWKEKGEEDLLLDNPEKSLKEVEAARRAGVDTIVDATAIDYGRQPSEVYKISVKTGMNIIGTAGFNKGFLWSATIPGEKRTYRQWITESSVEDLTRFIINEVEIGMQGTKIKGGQVKFGTGYNAISPLEAKTIRAACRAHLETGAPVHAHTEAGTMAMEQIKYIREEGVDLSYVSFGHMDRNPDAYYHLKIADTGAFLCFDGIGKIKYAPESVRIQCILELAKRGYQNQILASGDTARKSYYHSYGWALGLPYIREQWTKRLMEEAAYQGVDGERLVQDIFVHNPRRCFAFKKKEK